MTPERRRVVAWALLGGGLALACGVRLGIGTAGLGLPAWGGGDVGLWEVRGLRLAVGAVVGGSLAAAGVALQALLRNPLAEPFILGLSTGAGVGVLLQRAAAWGVGLAWLGAGPMWWGALLGAGVNMGLVYALGRCRGMIDPLSLLLAGVVLGTIHGAVILAANGLAGPYAFSDLMAWMAGYLGTAGLDPWTLPVATTLLAAGLGVLWWWGGAMDVATLSDDEAASLGVDLRRLRALLLVTGSVLAASAVVLAGPIAFVGLVGPHVARLAVGPRHRPLLIASVLAGAALVVGADATSAALALWLGIGILPVGVLTAAVGGLTFLVMLRKQA